VSSSSGSPMPLSKSSCIMPPFALGRGPQPRAVADPQSA
jgi:hypothetical protein